MAMAEGAALHILTRQAHTMAFQQQGPEGKRFTGGPINTLSGFNRLALLFQLPRDLGIDAEFRRDTAKRLTNFLQNLRRDRCCVKLLCLIPGTGGLEAGPMPFQPIRLVRTEGL